MPAIRSLPRRWGGVLALCLLIGLVPPALAGATTINVGSMDFAISIAKLPPTAKGGAATCTTSGSTTNCSAPMTINQSGVSLPGAIVDIADHLNGQLTDVCDIAVTGAMTYSVPTGQPATGTPPNLQGTFSGTQNCTFTATFGSSSFSGTLVGSNTLHYLAGSGTWTTNLAATVTGGTGTFAGDMGTGTFTSTQPMSASVAAGSANGGTTPTTTTPGGLALTAGTVGSPYAVIVGGSNTSGMTLVSGTLPPGVAISGTKISGTPTTAGSYTFVISEVVDGITQNITATIVITGGSGASHARTLERGQATGADGTGTMHVALRRGSGAPIIVAPGARVSAKSDGGLIVTSTKGSNCHASATSGHATVALGGGVVRASSGRLVLAHAVRPKLAKGPWMLHVTCGSKSTTKRIIVS